MQVGVKDKLKKGKEGELPVYARKSIESEDGSSGS